METQKSRPKVDKNIANAIRASIRAGISGKLKAEGRYAELERSLYVADKLVGHNFWLPTVMDFRGRMYYSSGTINHQKSDVQKALISVDHYEALGKDGFEWLLWSVASTSGFDKASRELRIKHTLDNLVDITDAIFALRSGGSSTYLDSIKKEKEFPMWVISASALVDAIESGDPENFFTNVTVAVDATCSGLQILSLVALDKEGGSMVNLTPNGEDAKSDVYKEVTSWIINKYKGQDNPYALWLTTNPKFDRKITKRTVMTIPYAVTPRTGGDNVSEALLEESVPIPRGEEAKTLLRYCQSMENRSSFVNIQEDVALTDEEIYRQLGHNIALDIFDAVDALLPAAMNIMKELKKLPRTVLGSVAPEWYTPDGLLVKQRNPKEISAKWDFDKDTTETTISGNVVSLRVQSRITTIVDPLDNDPIRAGNGMAPNWVHSLDGSLVRYVVRNCNFPIICIHDSFACHPANVTYMQKTIREGLVWLAESDPLGCLADDISALLTTEETPEEERPRISLEHLKIGTLDPNEVLESEFAFC